MKHTFIFKRDKVVDEDDLCRLVKVLHNVGVSYKTSQEDRRYDFVQVFTDQITMHHIAYKAYFSGEQLRVALPAARRRGDTAVSEAQERFGIRRKFLTPAQREVLGKRVHDCAVKLPDDTARLNWLEARGAGLNRPNCAGGLAHVWLADGLDRPVHHYDQTYREVIDRAMGYKPSPPMGSTPATRRSKRSA